MKRKQSVWDRLTGLFNREHNHHRICRLCKKSIKRHHKWHQVRVGWMAPWFCCEHRDCANPTLETPFQLAERMGEDLSFSSDPTIFESTSMGGLP